MVVSGSTDGRVQLWDTKEGSVVGNPWKGHDNVVRCLDWSPNTLEITSGSYDGTIRRWNPRTGRQCAPPIDTHHGWVNAVKYSPQGNKLASGGADKMIRVWSNCGELLIEINGHDDWVWSLCWSMDSKHIFSSSSDCTIRKWQSIDGEELVVLRGHTNLVSSVCLCPDESYLVSASKDHSVRIWDLNTNQPVGGPLLHNEQVWALAMFPDGKYIVSAGVDSKVYVWSLEAALKEQGGDQVGSAHDDNAGPVVKLKGHTARSRDIPDAPPLPKHQSRAFGRYGNDFWGNGINPTPRRSALFVGTPSPLRLRNVFGFLRPSQPTNALQPIASKTQPRNFNLFSTHPVDVAPCRDEDRYGIAPESDAEAAAAMQCTSDKKADNSTQQGQDAAGEQGSQVSTQGRPTATAQGPNSADDTRESSYAIGCCGFYLDFGRRRRTSD
ncbi:WD40-repeat-containing domain protein [Suillus ampliporus]|nr:WD40-repeat-containing domain protein [Suillus ampliporus]